MAPPQASQPRSGSLASSSKHRPEDLQADGASPRSLKVVLKLKVKNDGDGSAGGEQRGRDQDVDSVGQQRGVRTKTTLTPAVERTAAPASEAMPPPTTASNTGSMSKKGEREVADPAKPATAAATTATPKPKTRREPGPTSKSATPKPKVGPRANAMVQATSTTTSSPTPTRASSRKPATAAPTPNNAATTAPKKQGIVRRHRRGRPRNVSLLAAAAYNAQLNDAGVEQGREAEIASKDETSLRFRFLSDRTFPVLVDTALTEAAMETRVAGGLEGEDEGQNKREVHNARRCACCGVSEPAAVAPTSTPEVAVASSTRNDRQAPLMTPPWSKLNLKRTRHVNVDTLSTTDLVITRTGIKPNTLGFWYDMTVAEQAMASEDLDFKMMCLGLIWGRERADFSDMEGNVCRNSWVGRGLWDCVLREGVDKGKMWRKRRRLREREREKAARWAVWEEGVRNRTLGGFVEDTRGAWVLRAPGLDGAIRKMLRLGYKRVGIADGVVT